MSNATLIKSFRSSLNAGETRRQAHETVMTELQDLLTEYLENGLDTGILMGLLDWWCDTDYRTL